jgi:hypothetical protein
MFGFYFLTPNFQMRVFLMRGNVTKRNVTMREP